MTDYYKRGQYIPGLRVNGMDVMAVLAPVRYGQNFVKAGNGPLVYEYVTYRYAGHSMSDPGISYRSREELRENRANDPITNLKTKLADWGIMTDKEAKSIDKEVRKKSTRKSNRPNRCPSLIRSLIYCLKTSMYWAASLVKEEAGQ